MHIMIDNIGTIWYLDPVWFQVYSNRERKMLNIIKGLIQVFNNLISLDKLSLLVVTYKSDHFLKDDNKLVEIQNNDKKSNAISTASVEEEQK